MKERPILFSGQMVRAILDGRKTQTRRVIKPQPQIDDQGNLCGDWISKPLGGLLVPKLQDIVIHCPFGKIGDRLWVRETWHPESSKLDGSPAYRADVDYDTSDCKWKSPVFMPRWASRIALEITNIRVERLNDISEEDATSEGVDPSGVGRNLEHLQYRAGYQYLWESLHGKGSWNLNQFVWVIEFRRI